MVLGGRQLEDTVEHKGISPCASNMIICDLSIVQY